MQSQRQGKSKDRESYWASVISEQAASGLGVEAWCREHQVAKQSFYAWRKRLQANPQPETPVKPVATVFPLLPVQVTSTPVNIGAPSIVAPLEIEWPSGLKLRLSNTCDVQLLAQLLPLLATADRKEAAC